MMPILNATHCLKRDYLIAKCAQQRQQTALCVTQMQGAFNVLDTACNALHLIKKHPWLILTTLLLLKQLHAKRMHLSLIKSIAKIIVNIRLISAMFAKVKHLIKHAGFFAR